MNFTRLHILAFAFLLLGINLHSQSTCSTPTVISSVPYAANGLSTFTSQSFDASGVCSTMYDEKNYIFKYTPIDNQQISISVVIENYDEIAGIYIFSSCNPTPSQCLGFEEDVDGLLDFNLAVSPGQDYYIFIATETAENFNISLTKEEVQGVAINKSEPTQTLDVNGAVRIGNNNSTPYAGTIRWNEGNSEFEGYNGTEWVQLSEKKEFGKSVKIGQGAEAIDGVAFARFGLSVAISGEYAVVGSPTHQTNGNANQGKAYIFKRSSTSWIQEGELIASDGAENDRFGGSVAISGNYVVIGSSGHDTNNNNSQGKAYVFLRSGFTWIQEDMLIASDGVSDDFFGSSVGVSGDYAVIGSAKHNTNGNADQGKAYVYKRTGTSWIQEDILIASDGEADDLFGSALGISGDYVVVGSFAHNTNANNNQGKAYVYMRTGTSWMQTEVFFSNIGEANDEFGKSVAISDDLIIIGSPGEKVNSYIDRGKVYIFRLSGMSWIQEDILNSDGGVSGDNFGESVSISGNYALIACPSHDTHGNPNQGKAYIFRLSGTSWLQQDVLIAEDGADQDQFGTSVAISGDNAIVGSSSHNLSQGKVYFY